MQPNENILVEAGREPIEVVIGVFDHHEDASRVAASLRGPDINLQKVSVADPGSPSQLPEIVYEDIDDISTSNIADGAMLGGAIGAGSGLLLLGIPILNVAAPIAGALAGAWIGSVAGIDEASRGIRLPDEDDYRQMLKEGKSFVVIAGDEATRMDYGHQMVELGAKDLFQHPPVQQSIR